MKIKQIAVASDSDNGESLYALGEDGKLYLKSGRYFPPKCYDGVLKAGYYVHYWGEVDLPIGDPTAQTIVTQEPEIRHLWTDEEVEKLKAKGLISTEPPASTPGICVHCNTPTGDESSVCKDCEFPF